MVSQLVIQTLANFVETLHANVAQELISFIQLYALATLILSISGLIVVSIIKCIVVCCMDDPERLLLGSDSVQDERHHLLHKGP
jgi:hypothetical protein